MILVTGGTGFFGRHLVSHLATSGREVRVLSRNPRREALPEGVRCTAGDLRDGSSLARALEGIDVVVHAAAALGGAPEADLTRLNVEGTSALARAARQAGVRRFLHVSSAGVYGDGAGGEPHRETDVPRPGTAYERSKLASEAALAEALEGSGVSWTILRPAGLYGPDRQATAALFGQVARRRLWLHGATRVVVHPTHVEDLVDAAQRALGREDLRGEVLNVGGERALEYSALIAEIGRRVGREPVQLRLPALRRANRAVDTSRARKLLGFAPMPLAAGLDRTAAELSLARPQPG